MSQTEMLLKEVEGLSPDYMAKVFDFIDQLKHKPPQADNHADTGELPYNAETIAAIEEGDAIVRGEIPSPAFHSLEELLADLRS